MIIKADQEGIKAITELLDTYLKTHGIKGMQLTQIVSQSIIQLTPDEIRQLQEERNPSTPNAQMKVEKPVKK